MGDDELAREALGAAGERPGGRAAVAVGGDRESREGDGAADS